MSTLRSTPIRLVAILIALAAAVVLSTVAMTRDSGGSVTVTAFFRDSSPLTVGNEVRAAGVRVGEIRSIELQHGRARVEMDIEKAVLPLHRDAKATVTDKNLLGERFVDLQPGNPSAPAMGKPLELPVAQTDRVVDLQQVLNAVDDPTGTALSALLTTVGEGSEKQGPQIAEAIRALAPAMRHTDQLGRILGDQNQLLSQLVGNAQPVAGAMATDRGRKLDNLVGSAEQTMSTVAENRQATQDTLQRMPETIAKARRELGRVGGVADSANTTLSDVRPVTQDLTKISGELRRFSDTADPALASLPPVLDRGNVLLHEAAPVAASLRSAGPALRSTAGSGRALDAQALNGRHMTDLMEFLKGWALSTTGYDAIGHYFRASVPVTPRAVGQVAGGPVPGAPKVPVPDLPLPQVPNLPLPGPGEGPIPGQGPLPGVGSVPLPPMVPSGPNGNSATGLDQQQENSMLGQLLGGR